MNIRRSLAASAALPAILAVLTATSRADDRVPMRLEDVLSLAEIGDVNISADGEEVLYTVRTSDLARNRVDTHLWTVAAGGAPVERMSFAGYARPRWRGRTHDILFLGRDQRGAAVWELKAGATTPSAILRHPGGISGYFVAPDGETIAFTTSGAADTMDAQARLVNSGAVIDTARHHAESTIASWDGGGRSELWLREPGASAARRLSLPETATPWRDIADVAWAPDSSRLAVVVYLTGTHQTEFPGSTFVGHIIIVERSSNRTWPLGDSPQFERILPRWSNDGQRLVVAHKDFSSSVDHPLGRRVYGPEFSLLEVRADGSSARRLSPPRMYASNVGEVDSWWASDGHVYAGTLAADRLTRTIVRLSPDNAAAAVTDARLNLSGCTLALDTPAMACVAESTTEPPEVAQLELQTGAVRRLTALNARFKSFQLADIEPFVVTNRFGYETANLLVKPRGYQPGRRYPLLIALYYFRNRFVTQAQLIPNFPIQAFANAGFAVLLTNYPEYTSAEPPRTFAKMAIGENPLASLEAAVGQLAGRGLADPARVGIMGWSYGGFLTQFALTQSKTFAAGSVVDGGWWNPLSYWMNPGDVARSFYDETFGGPPEGATLREWQDFAPSFNVDRLTAPVMFETHNTLPTMHVQHLDFIAHASCAGAAIEGVFYPNAPHILTAPAQRLSSMARHLDWFRYWLLGEEDPAPDKRDQYERWSRLRDTQKRRAGARTPGTSLCRG